MEERRTRQAVEGAHLESGCLIEYPMYDDPCDERSGADGRPSEWIRVATSTPRFQFSKARR